MHVEINLWSRKINFNVLQMFLFSRLLPCNSFMEGERKYLNKFCCNLIKILFGLSFHFQNNIWKIKINLKSFDIEFYPLCHGLGLPQSHFFLWSLSLFLLRQVWTSSCLYIYIYIFVRVLLTSKYFQMSSPEKDPVSLPLKVANFFPNNRSVTANVTCYYFFALFSHFNRRRQWQPTPVFLSGKSHGRSSQVGCSPWGH